MKSMIHRSRLTVPGILATLVAGLGARPALAETIQYSDSQFDNKDWSVFQNLISGGSSAVGQDTNSVLGNAGPYRRMTHSIMVNPLGNLAPTFVNVRHINIAFTYNPGVSGAIDSIDLTMDARIFSFSSNTTPAVGQAFMLVQDGKPYFYDLGDFTNMDWRTFSATDLKADDFVRSGGLHPDFSAEGGPIQFGYLRSNTNTGQTGDVVITHGIDNFGVTITTLVPGPGSVSLLGMSAMIALRRRRR